MGKHSMHAANASTASGIGGETSLNKEDDPEYMQKLKGEFVEYVKEILTKTTSQVAGTSAAGGVMNKQKQMKLSQMNMIEEVTYFLKEGRENR